MLAVRYHEFGGRDVLRVEDVDPLSPAVDELLVEVEAVGVNPCDALRRQGLWEEDLPLIPGSDLAGVVRETGERVTRFEAGDRVFGSLPRLNASSDYGDRQGTYAEQVVVREDRLATLPEGVSFDVGGALGVVGVTAWRALFHFGDLQPGDTCFVHGGSGGVGHVAVQLAAATGATVVSTAAPERHDAIRELGADVVFDYGRDDLRAAVEEAVDSGVDVVLDHRLGEYAQFDIDVAAKNGTVVAIGGNHDEPQIEDLTTAIGKDLRIQLMDMSNEPNVGSVLERLAVLLADGALTARIARTYGLADAADAQRAVAEDSLFGKVILTP